MEKIKVVLGYLMTLGAFALQAYAMTKTDPATAAALTAPVAAIGSRLLQQTTPQGKEVFPK